jgi:hypothetical protein
MASCRLESGTQVLLAIQMQLVPIVGDGHADLDSDPAQPI